MRIDILTILPDLLTGPFSDSIMKRAQEKGHLEVHIHNIRDYSTHRQKSVDDYQYGGGAGMVMSIQPISAVIEKLKAERAYDEIIFMTPDGEVLEQAICNELSLKGTIMILCGHYKGVMSEFVNITSRVKYPLAPMFFLVENLGLLYLLTVLYD